MSDHFSDPNSLLEFVAKKGNGIKGLVDLGISEVPQLYIQPPNKRFDEEIYPPLPSSDHQRLSPVLVPIDLSELDGLNHYQVLDAIVRAAETLGFFQVVNHGLGLENLEALKAAAHRFFGQPAEAKAGYLKGVSPSPLVRYSTSFLPENEEVLEWRDYVTIIYSNDDDAEKYWPKECKEELLEYTKISSKMVRRLFEILMEHLGVELEDSTTDSLIATRAANINFYPACPNPELTIGVGSHSDTGLLTVLLQDEIGGLYVKVEEDIHTNRKEEWIQIPPIPGALIINVGDSLQILSNGKYKSAEHKVYTTKKQSRVSIALFVAARMSQKIGPLPELVQRDGGALYRYVVYQDYLNNFFTLANERNKALDFVKICNMK